jgi:hypothetical protein
MRVQLVARPIRQALALASLLAATAIPFASAAPAEAAPVLPGLATNIYLTYSYGPANLGAPGTAAMFRVYNTSTTTAGHVKVDRITNVRHADGSYYRTDSWEKDLGSIAPGAYVDVEVKCQVVQGKWCSSYILMGRVEGQVDTNSNDDAATKMGNQP